MPELVPSPATTAQVPDESTAYSCTRIDRKATAALNVAVTTFEEWPGVERHHATAEETRLLPTTVEAGPVRIDVDRHLVTVRGETVPLPLKEFDLLEYLVRNAGRVLTRSQLIDRVWGADYVGDTKTLDVHVKRLRAKLEIDPSNPVQIVTVRGVGYRFERPRDQSRVS